MSMRRAGLLGVLTVSMFAGCNDEGDDVTNIINSLFRGSLTITSAGGATEGSVSFAFGGRGGDLDVTSDGSIFVGVNPPPLAPTLPSVPTTGTPVINWTDFQTITSGNAIINGSISGDTTGSTATLIVNTGDLVINGSLSSADNGGVETNLSINVLSGTVWINGTIRTGNVDGVPTGDDAGSLTITAQRIICTGTIDTRGENDSAGLAGDGGDVTFDTEGLATGQTGQIFVGGTVNLSGGNCLGLDAEGGDSGRFFSYFTSSSNGSIHVHGTNFLLNGGSATGTGSVLGGNGGDLDLQGDAGVYFNATFSGIGGAASSSDGDAEGGPGGDFFANDTAIADSGPVALFGTINNSGGAAEGAPTGLALGGNAGAILVLSGSEVNLGGGTCSFRGANSTGSGGEGGDVSLSAGLGGVGDIHFDSTFNVSDGNGVETVQGGIAGTIDIDTLLGDIVLSGSLIANGGAGSNDTAVLAGPSDGGFVGAQTTDGGSITIRAFIQADGGSDSNGADDNDGGAGGLIQFFCGHAVSSIYLDPGSTLRVDGGHAGGTTAAAFGGDAGQVELLTGGGSVADGNAGGNINMRGSILARGGSGLAIVGSFGGFGGSVLVDSDSLSATTGGADGRGGDITLHAGATIDVSGGFGGSGGDALNDLLTPSVTTPVAVIFDADGNDSDSPAENGVVLNLGSIIGRGAAVDGNGGDVLFDGLDTVFAVGPAAGFLDLLGSGLGTLGDFLSQ